MATIAILVVDMASGGLLRVQAEFGIAPTAFDFAAAEQNNSSHARCANEYQCWSVRAWTHRGWTYNNRSKTMNAPPRAIALKRVYDDACKDDGMRVLVDRLWPRGLTKESAKVDLWLRDLAPSNELRKWYHAHLDQWTEFRRKYLRELQSPECADTLAKLAQLRTANDRVTLLFASKDVNHNNATVLKEVVEESKKPPHITRQTSQAGRSRARE